MYLDTLLLTKAALQIIEERLGFLSKLVSAFEKKQKGTNFYLTPHM